jgi:hypothetical protein
MYNRTPQGEAYEKVLSFFDSEASPFLYFLKTESAHSASTRIAQIATMTASFVDPRGLTTSIWKSELGAEILCDEYCDGSAMIGVSAVTLENQSTVLAHITIAECVDA